VLSVEEKAFSIRFSKGVQRDLPEGTLADVNEQMRGPVNSGHVAQALLLGTEKLVSALAGKIGFNTEGMDQPPAAAAAGTAGNTGDAAANEQPRSTPVKESKSTVSPTQATDDSKTISDPKSSLADAKSQITEVGTPAPTRKKESGAGAPRTSGSRPARKDAPADDAQEAEEVEVTLSKPLDTRINLLKDFIATHPDSKSKARAAELLIVARAALGDEKLKAGETAAGVGLLLLALNDAPPDMPDKLYYAVIAQIPVNLYVRGEVSAALKAAQQLEAKVANNPKRLLALSGFYREIERGDEAIRIAEQVIRLAPDLAEGRNALALALHISLRLDEAAVEYKHALELDPKTRGARRALADLDRAAGRFEEALALYNQQLTAEPGDKPARMGLVITLFELGKIDEAKEKLQAALKDDPTDLLLLTGAAYWLVAHGDSKLALSFAEKAVSIEPRYTWAQIALARSLVAQKHPLYAERSMRFALQYGKFPTLDYELASTLASLGLYEEASQALAHSFTLKDGQITTLLANRVPARGASFTEVLALERRASIFQPTAADTEDNARLLKALMAFTKAINPPNDNAKIDEASAIVAAREFTTGNDEMRSYRQLYAASRLLQHGVAFQTAQELSDAARDGVDAAIAVPAVTVAVQADELADIRARAIAAGGTPDVPDAPRNVLANIMRGRIEELSGWALFNLDKTAEAVEHLRRAIGILPPGTPLWQTAGWHLGVALQQAGNDAEALGPYIQELHVRSAGPGATLDH
jgi:tetratricopeptide (TPR) repeat protein